MAQAAGSMVNGAPPVALATTLSEYLEQKSDISVVGRISQPECIKYCLNLGFSNFVLDILRNGYHIPFAQDPRPTFEANN